MPTNEASSGYTPIMAGRVLGKSRQQIDNERPPREADSDDQGERTVRNVRTGNAKVGVQADVINGDVNQVIW